MRHVHLKEKDESHDGDKLPKRQKSPEEIEITRLMAVNIFDLIVFYVHLLVVAARIVITNVFELIDALYVMSNVKCPMTKV